MATLPSCIMRSPSLEYVRRHLSFTLSAPFRGFRRSWSATEGAPRPAAASVASPPATPNDDSDESARLQKQNAELVRAADARAAGDGTHAHACACEREAAGERGEGPGLDVLYKREGRAFPDASSK
eukprot:6178206-Pleurochrysis_carterae.AAC.3